MTNRKRREPLLLGADVGTSAVRVGIFSPEGHLRGNGRAPYALDRPQPGWVECDPEAWWQAFIQALADACRDAGVGPEAIGAVGIGVLYPCITLLDAALQPTVPAILYNDQRSLDQIAAARRDLPLADYERRIGNVLTPGTCAVSSIAWLRDNRPDAYRNARCIAWTNTFMSARLTGHPATDPSMAALSGLAAIDDCTHWSPELCAAMGIDSRLLPPIMGAADRVGLISPEAARQTGIRPGVTVACGCGDIPAATLGAGVVDQRTMVYSAGSTDCVSVPLAAPLRQRSWVNCGYLDRHRWLGVGTATSSGISVEWFCREWLPDLKLPAAYEAMTQLAAASPPGANGLLYLPYLQGERTPVWDPLARGAFVGLAAATRREDMARAVFEGTAFALRHILTSLGPDHHLADYQIRAVGGCTRNPLWNQIKTDVLQRPLDILRDCETGILGAALLGAIATGLYPSAQEAAKAARATQAATRIEPDRNLARCYNRRFDLFKDLYPVLAPAMHELASQEPYCPS